MSNTLWAQRTINSRMFNLQKIYQVMHPGARLRFHWIIMGAELRISALLPFKDSLAKSNEIQSLQSQARIFHCLVKRSRADAVTAIEQKRELINVDLASPRRASYTAPM